MLFSEAVVANDSIIASNSCCESKTVLSISTRLLSILDKSSILFIMPNKLLELFSIIDINSFCSSLISVPLRISVKPMIPFIGVLISCDILARNRDLALFASSAATLSSFALSINASRSLYASLMPWSVLRSESFRAHTSVGISPWFSSIVLDALVIILLSSFVLSASPFVDICPTIIKMRLSINNPTDTGNTRC